MTKDGNREGCGHQGVDEQARIFVLGGCAASIPTYGDVLTGHSIGWRASETMFSMRAQAIRWYETDEGRKECCGLKEEKMNRPGSLRGGWSNQGQNRDSVM